MNGLSWGRHSVCATWGAETRVRVLTGGFPSWLCGSLVLADQAIEDFLTLQADPVEVDGSHRSRGWLRRSQASRSMGTVEVVVAVGTENHVTRSKLGRCHTDGSWAGSRPWPRPATIGARPAP
jgi:hypothetical protein